MKLLQPSGYSHTLVSGLLMTLLLVSPAAFSVEKKAPVAKGGSYPPKVITNIYNGCTNACAIKSGDPKRVLCSESCQCFSQRLPNKLAYERMNAYESAAKSKEKPDPAVSKIISTLAHECAQEVLNRLKRH